MDAPAGQDAPGPPEPPEPPEPPCPPGGAPSLEKAPLIDGSFSMDRPKPLDNKPRTASLIVADRSRGDEDGLLWPEEPYQPGHKEGAIVMAGPMLNWDPIFVINLILGVVTTTLAALGTFTDLWFTYTVTTEGLDEHYSLFDSRSCDSADSDKEVVCQGDDKSKLGKWVLVVQILAITGLALCVINVLLQLINLCLKPRVYLLHAISLYVMAAAGTVLMMAGQIVHHYSVWRDVITKDSNVGAYLRIEPLGSGLFLIGTIFAGWCCVMIHVSSHGPGPVSMNTRFLHTLDREPVPEARRTSGFPAKQSLVITEGPGRRDSVHSTEV